MTIPQLAPIIGAPRGCCGHASGIYFPRPLWFGGCATHATPCSVPGYSYCTVCPEKSERSIAREFFFIRVLTGVLLSELVDQDLFFAMTSLQCVCVFFPFILDIKFAGRTSRGHTGGRSHSTVCIPEFLVQIFCILIFIHISTSLLLLLVSLHGYECTCSVLSLTQCEFPLLCCLP